MKTHFRKWWRTHALAAAAIALLAAFAAGAFTAHDWKTINGTRLDKTGQAVYAKIAGRKVEQGQRAGEDLPAAAVAKLTKANQKAALAGTAGPNHPVTLATPEPITRTELVRNYSSRHGARPALFVVHDTESPNAAGLADVEAIRAWFNNSLAQASSNYTTDADGNTILMVPDTEKAWTQAYFNPWSISDEMIGYASQRSWPETQLRAVAQIAAGEMSKWGIPVQEGAISGCTITRPGIVQHSNLGQCGGGHHDAGPAFPMGHFVQLVKQYQAGGLKPKPKPKPKRPAWYTNAVKAPPMWSWFAWRDHHHPAKLRPTNIPRKVPAVWWRRYALHARGR